MSIFDPRAWVAVPFVGKDMPSPASEFAHPDVTIGLTILAYRIEGLRMPDFKRVMLTLDSRWRAEPGPQQFRPTVAMYRLWCTEAAAFVRQKRAEAMAAGTTYVGLTEDECDVPTLEGFQVEDDMFC